MTRKKFRPGCTYRHRNDACTTDLHVLKVRFVGPEYTKLKVQYVNRLTGNPHYIGKGQYGNTEDIRILAESYKDWTIMDPYSKPKEPECPPREDSALRSLCEEP